MVNAKSSIESNYITSRHLNVINATRLEDQYLMK